jgi:hypothetical protein
LGQHDKFRLPIFEDIRVHSVAIRAMRAPTPSCRKLANDAACNDSSKRRRKKNGLIEMEQWSRASRRNALSGGSFDCSAFYLLWQNVLRQNVASSGLCVLDVLVAPFSIFIFLIFIFLRLTCSLPLAGCRGHVRSVRVANGTVVPSLPLLRSSARHSTVHLDDEKNVSGSHLPLAERSAK